MNHTLVLRNIRRSLRDYSIYFLTLTLLPDASMSEHKAISVTVKAWGIQNSLTGFTPLSFADFI